MGTDGERARIAQDVLDICKVEILSHLQVQVKKEVTVLRAEQARWRALLIADLHNNVLKHSETAEGSDSNARQSFDSQPVQPENSWVANAVGDSSRQAYEMSKVALRLQIASLLSMEEEKAGKLGRALPFLLRSLRCIGAVLLVLFMVFFFSWGAFKIAQPTNFETKTETFPWKGGAMALPRMGFTKLPNQAIEVKHCVIEKGNISTKQCEIVDTQHECELGNDKVLASHCLNNSLRVVGTFGDDQYSYVVVSAYVRDGLDDGLALAWEHHESLSRTVVNSQYYTSIKDLPMKSELYFQKVTVLEGDKLGVFGRNGIDHSFDFHHKAAYMVKESEYTYAAIATNQTNAQGETPGRKFYLRATKMERQDFHDFYSILNLLDSLGGLYTSLSFILFIPLVVASTLLRYGGLLIGFRHGSMSDLAEIVVQAPADADTLRRSLSRE
mmetsp:Transcript_136034/g.271364  ORF Transcript_136034/g.271364 Transcript_136034/m.271364 type:complete len:442 (+) Transcript_136034:47-1372(+)